MVVGVFQEKQIDYVQIALPERERAPRNFSIVHKERLYAPPV
jgi:hypothetical protein